MREQDSGPEPAGTGSGPARPGRLSLPSRRITATRGTGAASPSHPHFSQPVRQIMLMLTVLALVLAGGWIAYGRILPIFMANR